MSSAIYIHFPFCYSKCNYCSFFSSTNNGHQEEYYKRLYLQIEDSYQFLDTDPPSTLYFGGGTPSLFDLKHLERVVKLYSYRYEIEEITLELNPADITEVLISTLHGMGVNRLSIGIQSLDDTTLHFLGRRHSSQMVHSALQIVEKYFKNYSVDFIIGLPEKLFDFEKFKEFEHRYNFTHLSVYGLSIEEGTKFYDDGVEICGEDFSREFLHMDACLLSLGYEHYEISNYSKPGLESKHNSKYWSHDNYIGIGPSAHSFWDSKRFYLDEDYYTMFLSEAYDAAEKQPQEECDEEQIMLSLRTNRGVNIEKVKNIDKMNSYVKEGFLVLNHDCVSLR